MNKFTKYLSLGVLLIGVSATASDAPKFTYELATDHEKAMHALDRVRTITADALKTHGVETIHYRGKDFRSVRVDEGDKQGKTPTLKSALEDVLTGYTLFTNIEDLYLELYAINFGTKPEGPPEKPIYVRLFQSSSNLITEVFKNAEITEDGFNSKYSERITMFNKVFFDAAYDSYTRSLVLDNLLEGVWYLMTGKQGFHLQTLEAHAAQNVKFINDLELAKMLNQEKEAKIQKLIDSSDQSHALKAMRELGIWFPKLGGLLNAEIGSNAE